MPLRFLAVLTTQTTHTSVFLLTKSKGPFVARSPGELPWISHRSLGLISIFREERQQSTQTQCSRVEVAEVISAEQRCFIVLTFFSADSENMINISADQLYFRADQLWFSLNQRCSEMKNSALFQSWIALFQRETALNQRCSALIFLALKHWIFSADSALIYSDAALIFTHVDEAIKIW